jgi:hypothetical protein
MNVFRDPSVNTCVDFPRERVKHRLTMRPVYKPPVGEPPTIAGDAGYSADTELIEAALATWDTTQFTRHRAAAPSAE